MATTGVRLSATCGEQRGQEEAASGGVVVIIVTVFFPRTKINAASAYGWIQPLGKLTSEIRCRRELLFGRDKDATTKFMFVFEMSSTFTQVTKTLENWRKNYK